MAMNQNLVSDWSLLLQVLDLIERNGRLKQPELCPDDTYTLMRHCWSYEPINRPTFSKIHNELQMSNIYENIQPQNNHMTYSTV